MTPWLRLALAGLTAVTGVACQSVDDPPLFCFDVFAMVDVAVVDTVGASVPGLTPAITIVRTGQGISPAQLLLPGTYVVISDAEKGLIRPSGETLRFVIASGQRSANADFVVDVPGAARCHVNKVSGPASITLR